MPRLPKLQPSNSCYGVYTWTFQLWWISAEPADHHSCCSHQVLPRAANRDNRDSAWCMTCKPRTASQESPVAISLIKQREARAADTIPDSSVWLWQQLSCRGKPFPHMFWNRIYGVGLASTNCSLMESKARCQRQKVILPEITVRKFSCICPSQWFIQ